MNRRAVQAFALLCATVLVPGNPLWADPPPPANSQTSTFTAEQIQSLVAPIALYPDELVSQILVAATYPLEIVQAYQWVQQHPNRKGQELTTAAQQQTWDPSIQALVAFPDVLKRMNQDVTWTTNLGNAFLSNQAGVMDEIQKMRTRAQEAGKLTSTEQQKVVSKTENGHTVLVIEPANPNVIYVPDYDPVWIWGPAPVYYPYPYWYYPAPPPFGWCWWGTGIYLGAVFVGWHGWGGWGWHPHWYNRTIIVNNRTVWTHNSFHRVGVAYPNRALGARFQSDRRGSWARPHFTARQVQGQLHTSAGRVGGMRSADRFGHHQISTDVYNHNRNRGKSSLGHTGRGAAEMTKFNPDKSWRPVQSE